MLRRALLLRSGAEAMGVETRRNCGEDGRDGCCNGNGGTGAAMAAALLRETRVECVTALVRADGGDGATRMER